MILLTCRGAFKAPELDRVEFQKTDRPAVNQCRRDQATLRVEGHDRRVARDHRSKEFLEFVFRRELAIDDQNARAVIKGQRLVGDSACKVCA